MKQIFLAALAMLLYGSTSAAPKIKCKSNGYWSNPLNWDLNRAPVVGDTITIPAGYTMIINDDRVINGFVYLQIYGTLSFQNNNSTLKLGSTAIVIVYSNGQITGGGSASQKLRIGNSTVFDGNDAPVYGPKMATGSTNGFEVFTAEPLPVIFAGFSLTRKNDGKILVQWSTSDEISADRFEIERSLDGMNWSGIGQVAAMNQSASLQNYSYYDQAPASQLFYRIKQIDIDGQHMYSSIRMIRADIKEASIRVAAVNGKILLHFPLELQEETTVSLISFGGQVLSRQSIRQPSGQFVLDPGLRGQFIVIIHTKKTLLASEQVRL